jgi:sugar/nucleoside kinase (ribokinase family)
MNPLDLLAVGDATKDVFVEINEATVNCTINSQTCLLCLTYAEKIPVKNVTQIAAAGNAANAAVGTARLGHKSALACTLGDDAEGRDLADALRQEGVDHRFVTIDKKHGTNYSTVLNFKGERTILVYHQPRVYTWPTKVPDVKWVYYTSIGKNHEKYEKGMLNWLAKKPRTKLIFNPGTHQLRRGLGSLKPAIKRSEVFIVNKEEAEFLLQDGIRSVQTSMRSLKQIGCGIVIITDGANGSWSYDGEHMWRLPMFPGKAVERTGAGDSYGTGVANAIMAGETLPEAMRWGTANAQSVVKFIGPQAGLLTVKEMKAALKKASRIKPVKVTTA